MISPQEEKVCVVRPQVPQKMKKDSRVEQNCNTPRGGCVQTTSQAHRRALEEQ
jgi:hypothetical protein